MSEWLCLGKSISEPAVSPINRAGGRLNIKTPSYQSRNSHYKDETVSRLAHLYDGNSDTHKGRLYIEMLPRLHIGQWHPLFCILQRSYWLIPILTHCTQLQVSCTYQEIFRTINTFPNIDYSMIKCISFTTRTEDTISFLVPYKKLLKKLHKDCAVTSNSIPINYCNSYELTGMFVLSLPISGLWHA